MSLQLLFLLQMELRSLFQPSSGLPLSIGREVHKAEGTCPFGPCSTSWPYFGYQGSFNSLPKHLCPCSCLWCLRRPLYCGVNGWNLNEQLWVTIVGPFVIWDGVALEEKRGGLRASICVFALGTISVRGWSCPQSSSSTLVYRRITGRAFLKYRFPGPCHQRFLCIWVWYRVQKSVFNKYPRDSQ